MKTKLSQFTAKIVKISYAIEVPHALLIWLDGGFGHNKKNNKRQHENFDAFSRIDGISDIEYNGHFGPFVYFSAYPENSDKIIVAVQAIIQRCYRNMLRSAEYRLWLAENEPEKDRYGDKTDYPKIDLYVKTGKNLEYKGTTTWSKTCQEAVFRFAQKEKVPQAKLVARFQK